jgi:ferredoxin
MPNNYVVSYHMSDEKEVRKGLKEAQDLLIQLGKIIKNGDFISKNDKTSMAAIKSGLVNSMFCRFASKGEVHTVSDQCMKCGTCEKFCPVNNITMDGDKPVFGKQCISCYGCIHRCPVEAINIQGKTEKNGRYVCPDYIEWKKSSR